MQAPSQLNSTLDFTETYPIEVVRTLLGRTTAYFGVGAIQHFASVVEAFKAQGKTHFLFVTGGQSYQKSGAWAAIEPLFKADPELSYQLYNGVTPNPMAQQVEAAVALGRSFEAQVVVGIGGGSPIDAAKGVATLLANPEASAFSLYTGEFTPQQALPLVAINLTHGTGTEVNRFSVVGLPELDYKPGVAHECFYPTYAITDPALMQGLPLNQSRYTSIDAVNHALEAATSALANPLSIQLAQQSIALVAQYLPRLNKDQSDLRARYWLAYAALSAGLAIDNGAVHITHALEHPLSALNHDLAHALGLAMLMPSVWKRCYGAQPALVASLLSPLVPGLQGKAEEAEQVAEGLEAWLASVGVPDKLADQGFSEAQIERLVELVYTTPTLEPLLQIAPIPVTKAMVMELYREALKPLRQEALV